MNLVYGVVFTLGMTEVLLSFVIFMFCALRAMLRDEDRDFPHEWLVFHKELVASARWQNQKQCVASFFRRKRPDPAR
jgi:hypothetical protein